MEKLPLIPAELPATIQCLPSKWAHLALGVAAFVRNNLNADIEGKGVLAAVSGGADSLCLLFLLKALQSRLGLNLQVAHMDHGLRPSSAAEADWVKELCERLQLPYFCQRTDIGQMAQDMGISAGKALENTGRIARYAFFEEIRIKQGLDYIATAHNLNDLAEDVILRMLRGCGWPELGGMYGYDPRRSLIRPLLFANRQTVEQMLKDCQLPFLTDESNESMNFMRNRIRKNLIPVLLAENAGFLEHIRNLWCIASDDEKFWRDYIGKIKNDPQKFLINKQQPEVTLYFFAILEEQRAARLRIYRSCLEELEKILGSEILFFTSAEQINELDKAVWRRVGGHGSGIMRIQFAGGAVAIVGKNEIRFCLNNAS